MKLEGINWHSVRALIETASVRVMRRGSITSIGRTVNRHNRALSDTSLEFYHRRDLTPHSLVQSGQSRNTPGLSIDSRSVNVVEKDIVLDQKALMRSLAHRVRYRCPNVKTCLP